MLFTTILSTLALTSFSAASPLAPRQIGAPLSPWKITSLYSYKPSSQPGPDKNSRIFVRIEDPNTIYLMRASRFGFGVFGALTADCTISWPFPDGQPPFEQEILCTPAAEYPSGNFSVTLTPGSGGETVLDFGLKIVERRETTILANNYFYRQFEGEVSFKVGENYTGSCGEAGVCAGQLEGEVAVVQEVTQSVGSCEEYGGCT
ncbi:hypothetical protein BU25DRAFT_405134 [Macroventuria anomochaeta]|uniref:Uncharacterized protein n=1 Tax=Macroventuria anomochaeta TaxID=301207 RepID=A0ACB6SGB1_9PLEO|nr:uncharacterized protein BU25DRAFT_405134 [Macroventuria anomochaeta]KAF2633206.1 hypothetical protein BU25DRAFT_405134 [Macroventuria anomochaeta]